MALRLAWAAVWVHVSNFSYINNERREETENIEEFSSYSRKCFNTTRLSVVSSKSFPYIGCDVQRGHPVLGSLMST